MPVEFHFLGARIILYLAGISVMPTISAIWSQKLDARWVFQVARHYRRQMRSGVNSGRTMIVAEHGINNDARFFEAALFCEQSFLAASLQADIYAAIMLAAKFRLF